jgi:NAD(P)-dependent dehydrogenase (short-subunit alcohol dehydrogenase family)
VVNVASIGHRYGNVRLDDFSFEKDKYAPNVAYGQSKTANIWMTNEIERRYGSEGLHGLSLNPGGIRTELQRHVDEERLKFFDSEALRHIWKNPPQGAATQVYAALSKDLEGAGGKYLSNCEVQGPTKEPVGQLSLTDEGYEVWAMDAEGAKKLWEASLKMVGLQE